jgi:hypothetical protein
MSQEHHITGSHCWGQGASEGIREGAGTDLRHPFTLELACAVLHCSRHCQQRECTVGTWVGATVGRVGGLRRAALFAPC